ncbi:MAG: TRAP transporter large permease [Spirochaetales bacterium]|jgi:tripartite ATP-independent transporter DctM subunit|nr:TRAP transporter large permease [Spirochaetales bacterium]
MGIVALVFFVLLAGGLPLAFTIGLCSLPYFIVNDIPLAVAVQRMISSTQSFALLAVPFFVFAGNLMNETGITPRMIKFANVLTGHWRGGLAQVSLALSALMGGVSGSAVADAAMECRVLGPSMMEKGYSKGFVAAILGMGGLITATIPPSLGLILYGVTGEVSIGRLFIAGIVPGVLLMAAMMLTTMFIAGKRGYRREREKHPSFMEVLYGIKENFWALIFPVLLILGIRVGIFTASEAGAFAVVYAFLVGAFIYRELSMKKLWEVLRQTAADIGVIMLIIVCSSAFGYVVVTARLPQYLSQFIVGISDNRYVIMFSILGFLFIIGMFMEATANVLILVPIFLPLTRGAGFDDVHFGLLFMLINTMGGMTPPVGVTMYTACSLLDCRTDIYTKEAVPYIITVLTVVIVLVIFPEIVLYLPNMLFNT